MKQYLELLQNVLDNGTDRNDRTGVGTRSIFGAQFRHDLQTGFPLLTTKKLHLRSIVHELLWFLQGSSNISYLKENNVSIWDEWADENGNLGPIYGVQWRMWQGSDGSIYDQITNLIYNIKNNPYSRRHILTAWNVAEIDKMALPPCHCLCQFYVANGTLSCQLYQRSADIFLGVPFNIASYSLLTMMMAQICDLNYGDFVHSFGDVHLYHNHIEQAKLQLTRIPTTLPIMDINSNVHDMFSFVYDDFTLKHYEAQPHIPAPIAV